jgi:selenide,water dikinase
MTDVTGFGLLGHLHHMCRESGVAAELCADAVPAIEGVHTLLEGEHAVSGGARRNAAWAGSFARFAPEVPRCSRRLLVDATTSGGLLAALPPRTAAQMPGSVIGWVSDGPAGTIRIRSQR